MWAAGRPAHGGWAQLRLARFGVLITLLMGSTVVSGVLAASTARAATCGPHAGYPNDPGYARAENDPLHYTWDDEQWYLYGCIPQDSPLVTPVTEPEGASGMSVDRVWGPPMNNRGSDQVIVAYMEGGINWRIAQSCELRLRSYLNKGELPYPEDAAGSTRGGIGDQYDLNGDGVFNVDDYRNDPRVVQALTAFYAGGGKRSPDNPDSRTQPYLHKVGCVATAGALSNITPEDLIVAFGHCQVVGGAIIGSFPCDQSKHFDNDHNGYANDISGWNFNRGTNDPQTEQSIYEHFTGESSTLVGEGNNGFDNVGLCPLCRYIPIKAGDEAIDRPDRVAEAVVYAADMGVSVLDATSASLGLTPSVKEAIDYAYHRGMVITWASNDFESADHTDGMFYPHVWPGNSLTGDHSTRGGVNCAMPNPGCALFPFVRTNTTFRSRSSLTSYGPHALFSVPNNDGSTSTGTPTQAGVAAMVLSEAHRHGTNPMLNADEVKQVVRSTASYIGTLPTCPNCFQGISGTNFNIQYGYGRPNVYQAALAVDNGQVPPTADIRSPDWYQEVDPTRQATLGVTADVAAQRAGSYRWELQYATGAQPLDIAWQTFASGNGTTPQTVSGTINLAGIAASFANSAYSVDAPGRTSIETYDVTVRVHVFADQDTATAWKMGEDRRAFHLRHDPSERPGFPVKIGTSGDASPAMADIEGRGWLDTILATADGSVHAFRPDGSEAPGFPLHTGPSPGMDPSQDVNYLGAQGWQSGRITRSRDGFLSPPAVGDLRHDGGLEIVASSAAGLTYAWDGLGRLLPGFPVLNGTNGRNGTPNLYHQSVPPPDTPYSFDPENIAGGAPVLADLEKTGKLDIIQVAGDNQVHAWRPDGSAVPGWPVSALLPPTVDPGVQRTHDSKIVTTPALADINGDGIPDVVVGLDDSTLDNGGTGIRAYLMAYDGRGTRAAGPVAGNPALLPGYPVTIQGLIQGYGVAQDFVTQGTESPAIYDDPTAGPQAVVNANLFFPIRVDLKTASAATAPFAGASIAPIVATSGTAPGGFLVQFTTSASVGNVLGAPIPQVFQPGSAGAEVAVGIAQVPGGGIRVDNGLGAWQPAPAGPGAASGALLPQYAQYLQGLAFFAAPAIADVTGDGVPDILQGGDSAALHGFDGVSGQPASGFPKWTGGWSLWTPAVGDLTGSGTVSVAAATREGYLHVFDTPGKTSANHEAWHWHQDDRNTGHYGTDTRPPSGIRDLAIAATGAKWTLTFTATGDDWNNGTAAAYDVRCSANPITQDNFAQATPVDLGGARPAASGTRESLSITPPAEAKYCAVRAIDKAGNIGPIPLAAANSNGGVPAGTPGGGGGGTPNTSTGGGSAGSALLLLIAATAWRSRSGLRRRAR